MGLKLDQYDPESFSKGSEYSKATPEEQIRFNAFMESLANPRVQLPDRYHGAAQRLNKAFRLQANPMPIADEQLYLMDQQIVRTYYDTNIGSQILASVTDYMPNPRWTSEHYTVSGDSWPEFSRGPTNAFRTFGELKLGVEPTLVKGVGGAVKWDLPFTLLREGVDGVYDPDYWHSFKAGELLGKFWDERLCLGTAGENTSGDIGVTGLHNYSGLATQATGADGDNDLTAAGDIDFTIRVLLQNLQTVYEPGNNIIVSTSGPATEVFLHDSSYTDRSEYEIIKKKYFDSGLVSAWYVDNNIEADANAVGTGRIMMLRLGRSTVRRLIAYPLQKKPMIVGRQFEEDVSYAIIIADVFKYYNASAGVINSGDQTTTSAGIVQNGLFMTGGNYRPSSPPVPTYIGVS